MGTTRRRAARGTCVVAVLDGRAVATVTLCPTLARGRCRTYREPGVFCFEQLAVEPALQGRGLGDALLDVAEALAREQGATRLACDTAEPARHLVAWYERRGHRAVERTRWPGKAYTSVVLCKDLAGAARAGDLTASRPPGDSGSRPPGTSP